MWNWVSVGFLEETFNDDFDQNYVYIIVSGYVKMVTLTPKLIKITIYHNLLWGSYIQSEYDIDDHDNDKEFKNDDSYSLDDLMNSNIYDFLRQLLNLEIFCCFLCKFPNHASFCYFLKKNHTATKF